MQELNLGIEEVKKCILLDIVGKQYCLLETDTQKNTDALLEKVRPLLEKDGHHPCKILLKHYFPDDRPGIGQEDHLKHSVHWHERMQRPGNVITVNALSPNDSLIKRFWAFLVERFDPFTILFVSGLMTFALSQVYRAINKLPWDNELIIGAIIFTWVQFFFFLLLRAFDEHKDWDTDHQNFPERVLSLGLVNLGHIKAMGVFSVLFLYVASLYFGAQLLIFTTIVFVYSLLMLKEFFIADWLKDRMFLYGISHNFVITLSTLWIFVGYSVLKGGNGLIIPKEYILSALFINCMLFSLEVARKIRLPEFEKEDVDTYSQVIGHKAASYLALGMQLLAFGILFSVGLPLGLAAWAGMGLGFLLSAAIFFKFLASPKEEDAEKLDKAAALTYVFALMALIIGLW